MSDDQETPRDEKAVPDQLAAMQQKVKEALDEAKAAKRALKQFEGIDPTAYQELLAAQDRAEEEKAKAAGDWEKLQAKLDKKLAEKDSVIADLKRRNETTHRDAAALAAINKHGGNATLLRGIVSNALEVVEDGDGYSVVATVDGEKLAPSEYVARLKADDDFAGAFSGTGAGGAGSKPATESIGGVKLPSDIQFIG